MKTTRNNCRPLALVVPLAVLVITGGCSRGPTAVEAPPLEPEPMAAAAFVEYDKNGDGFLDKTEMTAFPALLDALKNHIDKDNDQRVSKEELVGRFEMWAQGGVGAGYLACRITKNGNPIQGAIVKLIPDACFGGVIQPAEGTTRSNGRATLAMDSSNLPADLQNFSAVQQGLYRVEITHPQLPIPAKYNTQSELGIEVSFDSGRNLVELRL